MFDAIFPKHWTTLQRLMWLKTNALARAVYEIVTGNPVSFTALAAPLRQLSVAFSPVQDLHGYDSPWPAGGGKNKVDIADFSVTSQYYGNYVTLPANTYALSFNVKNNTAITGTAYFRTRSGENLVVIGITANENDRVSGSFTLSEETDVRFIVSGSSSGYNYNISNVMVELGSSATSYAPYSNICPILGWDSLGVEQSSEILAELTSSASASGVTCTTNADGTVTVKGTCTGNVTLDFFRSGVEFPTGVSAGGKYIVSIENPIDAFEIFSIKNAAPTNLVSITNATHAEFTIPSDATGMIVRILAKAGVTYDTTLHVRFCPYDGYRSISITIGQTVYSGTLDVVTGVVTVDKVKVTSPAWKGFIAGTYSVCNYFLLTQSADTVGIGELHGAVSNMHTEKTAYWGGQRRVNEAGSATGGFGISTTGGQCIVYDSDTTLSEADFAAKYAGIEIVYPLATPLTIQLTPQEVQGLAGDNVLFSDANGDITVTYRSN